MGVNGWTRRQAFDDSSRYGPSPARGRDALKQANRSGRAVQPSLCGPDHPTPLGRAKEPGDLAQFHPCSVALMRIPVHP